MTYEQKEKIADQYLNKLLGLDWADLADTNSLHDYGETKQDIIEACHERMEGEYGMPIDEIFKIFKQA